MTLAINIIGSFAIMLFSGLFVGVSDLDERWMLFLRVGLCGGFTTFSSFADDLWVLGNKGDWGTSVLYLCASVIIGVLLVWAGRALIR